MSLTQALNSSLSGLRTAQAGLALVASNVANAETPGYVRKTLVQTTTAPGESGVGVRAAGINRELDQYVQRQLRVETSGASYAETRAQFYGRLQQLFGTPGADSALESVFNTFTAAVQNLATSPESYPARASVVSAAQTLAQQLNGMSEDVQALRSDAERGLADAVQIANDAMQHIAGINQQLSTARTNDAAMAVLQDQRDRYIDQLADLMDIRVVESGNNQLTVFTTSGVQLAGSKASQFAFQQQGTMTATAAWSPDPLRSGVGSVTLVSPTGDNVDLLANNAIHSGKMAALIEMRDRVLVETQAQLDAIAAAMSQALSDRTIAGTPVTSGAQDGLQVDLDGMLAGNVVRLSYTDTLTNTQRTVTFMRVDDPTALPLRGAQTTDPNDRVVGVSFAGGMAAVASRIAAALGGAGFTVSNPSGTLLRILDDGGTGALDVNALTVTRTATSLAEGSAELPLFLDGSTPYSGAVTGAGSQRLGLAGRIAVNGTVVADPTHLVVYRTSPPTAAGDATRPDFIYRQLTGATQWYPPEVGIGTASAPFRGSMPGFLRQVLSQQGEAAAAASNLKQGQDVVVNALRQRVSDSSSVNIDQEMATLLTLQNAYGANARVLSAVKDLFDILSNVMR